MNERVCVRVVGKDLQSCAFPLRQNYGISYNIALFPCSSFCPTGRLSAPTLKKPCCTVTFKFHTRTRTHTHTLTHAIHTCTHVHAHSRTHIRIDIHTGVVLLEAFGAAVSIVRRGGSSHRRLTFICSDGRPRYMLVQQSQASEAHTHTYTHTHTKALT